MDRIQRFINNHFHGKLSNGRIQRIHEFKRLVLNMPYTQTYYLYKKNPTSFFREDEFEARVRDKKSRVKGKK
jgi:hypothetical protein